MARGINKVILIGNLGRDPEVRYMQSGDAVTNITVATSESWKDRNTGQTQENTEWHRVVLFRRLGEIAGEYLRKGSQVYIEGKLKTRKWQDQSGQDRYTTEIVADNLQFLGGRQNSTQAPGGDMMGQGRPGPSANSPASTSSAQRNLAQAPQAQSAQMGAGAMPQKVMPPAQPFQTETPASGGHSGNDANPASFDDFDDEIPF